MIQELKQTNPGRKHTLEFFNYMIQVMANHGRYIQEGILRSWYCSTVQYSIHVVIIQGMASSVNEEFLLPEKEKDIVKCYI